MVRKAIGLPLVLLFLICCSDDEGQKMDCSDTACTQQFVTIMVTVKDDSGVAIPFDSFEVTVLDTGEDITRDVSNEEMQFYRNNGTYPLFGDEFSAKYQNDSVIIVFKGIIGGSVVVNETFTVGADCCHVLLIDGELDIVLN